MASGVHTEEAYIPNNTAPMPALPDDSSACGRADLGLLTPDPQPEEEV